MNEVQNSRFKGQISEVLSKDFTMSTKYDEKNHIIGAKFNTKEVLTKEKIEKLNYIGEVWELPDYSVKRSGTGVTFEFIPMVAEPA